MKKHNSNSVATIEIHALNVYTEKSRSKDGQPWHVIKQLILWLEKPNQNMLLLTGQENNLNKSPGRLSGDPERVSTERRDEDKATGDTAHSRGSSP